ncbi:Hypothetical_protein [Hexamita inflata]|uniref:Hypothetical_protein n=1 Tax=Hexamita inflata TaxID=28002 RepID=A0ABP1J5B2_9EUKA
MRYRQTLRILIQITYRCCNQLIRLLQILQSIYRVYLVQSISYSQIAHSIIRTLYHLSSQKSQTERDLQNAIIFSLPNSKTLKCVNSVFNLRQFDEQTSSIQSLFILNCRFERFSFLQFPNLERVNSSNEKLVQTFQRYKDEKDAQNEMNQMNQQIVRKENQRQTDKQLFVKDLHKQLHNIEIKVGRGIE